MRFLEWHPQQCCKNLYFIHKIKNIEYSVSHRNFSSIIIHIFWSSWKFAIVIAFWLLLPWVRVVGHPTFMWTNELLWRELFWFLYSCRLRTIELYYGHRYLCESLWRESHRKWWMRDQPSCLQKYALNYCIFSWIFEWRIVCHILIFLSSY